MAHYHLHEQGQYLERQGKVTRSGTKNLMLSQLVKQSPSWAAWNYSHVQFITIPLPPGVQCITQNKISIKLFWIQAIKQYQTQLFWAWCLNKIKTHQIILKKKFKREKLSHPWESKKAREIWRACYYVQKGHGFRENLVSVIVSTFLIFMLVDQLLLVDEFSQLHLCQKTTMSDVLL